MFFICLNYNKVSKVKVIQSCPTIWDPMVYTVHGILQTRILECIAFPFSRGCSQPRNRTQVSCIVGRRFYHLSHQGSLEEGTWVVPTFWLLLITLLWIFMYKFLCGYMLSFLLAIYLGMALLGHISRNTQIIFQSSWTIYNSISNAWGFWFLHIPVNRMCCYCRFF